MRCRVLAGGLATAVIAALAPGLAQAVPLPAPEPPSTITLITGDKITVNGQDVSPLPVPGREGTAFHVYQALGHTYVVPLDAAAAVASGRLDRRLFDLTDLQRFGYGNTADIPLIVAGSWSGATTQALPSLKAEAVQAKKGQAWAQLKDSGAKVWLDGKRQVSLDESVPQIGAPTVWQAGFTGKGVTVAVLGTGIDATHPDFAGRIADAKDFTSDNSTDGTIGHGTHVASTIAGSGAASNGKYRGVAPDATQVSPRELAAVNQHYDAQSTQSQYGYTWSLGSTKDVPHRTDAPLTVTLPFDRTEYYLADGRPRLRPDLEPGRVRGGVRPGRPAAAVQLRPQGRHDQHPRPGPRRRCRRPVGLRRDHQVLAHHPLPRRPAGV